MKTLQALSGLIFLICFIWVVVMVMPPYFDFYTFRDAVAAEALQATYNKKTTEEIRESLYEKAKELEIPISRDEIIVNKQARGVEVRAQYQVEVNLPLYPLELDFDASTKNARPEMN